MLVDSTSNSGTTSTVTGQSAAPRRRANQFRRYARDRADQSGFNPHAAASTSSAGGLYQFIDQTWLGMLKDAGPGLGYGRYADAITKTASGHYKVTDPAMRQEIMALRKDPTANAAMAGAFTQQNAGKLASQLGRNPSEGELYIAHFLGPSGAAKLINAAASSPRQAPRRASRMPLRPILPSSTTSRGPRSVSDVYGLLVHRYDAARATPPAPTIPTRWRHHRSRPPDPNVPITSRSAIAPSPSAFHPRRIRPPSTRRHRPPHRAQRQTSVSGLVSHRDHHGGSIPWCRSYGVRAPAH